MIKRAVIVNGVEFTTTAEEQITGSLLKQLWGASENDWVFVNPADGRLYRLEDDVALPLDVEQVFIVPAYGEG